MFKAIQYLVSSKKLEDGFGKDNVAAVNGRRKITRLCDDNMGIDLQLINHNIARVLNYNLSTCYGLEINKTSDFLLLLDVLRDPRAFHALDYSYIIFYLLFYLY